MHKAFATNRLHYTTHSFLLFVHEDSATSGGVGDVERMVVGVHVWIISSVDDKRIRLSSLDYQCRYEGVIDVPGYTPACTTFTTTTTTLADQE